MGILLANNIRQSPCTLAVRDFIRLGMECEVAARLGADLPPSGAPCDRDKVPGEVESLMTASRSYTIVVHLVQSKVSNS